jgi:1-acyl-sn-glycerol-3-phosphate acyltransferase
MRVLIAGRIGLLANKTSQVLAERGHRVSFLPTSSEMNSAAESPEVLVLFPFGSTPQSDWEDDFKWIEKILTQAAMTGIKRIVLRSSAVVYGSSFKNYGLMEEDRISLLKENSSSQRWARVEKMVLDFQGNGEHVSRVLLRFTNISDPAEGDFITSQMLKKVAFPLAGYDPRIQFVSVPDAVQALALAAEKEAEGIFNIAGRKCIPFRKCLKLITPIRIPIGISIQKPLRRIAELLRRSGWPGDSIEQIQYNWTVSTKRAENELGFTPRFSSKEALESSLPKWKKKKLSKAELDCDDFGLDPGYLHRWRFWFNFLTRIYWRVEVEGIENVPKEGKALLVSNHRGFMPFDGVVHRTLIHQSTKRQVRFLVIPSLFKFPFLSDFLIKQGGVVASQQNTARLFERKELVGIFPEGITGAFRMYKGAYRLGSFARDAFAKMAIEHQVPIIPAAVVGHAEIFPILAKLKISFLARWLGWPYLPLTPTFPLFPIPLPTKWHIRYLKPMSVQEFQPRDAGDPGIVRSLSTQFRDVMQQNIDDMLERRKHIFYGNIFDSQDGPGYRPTEN